MIRRTALFAIVALFVTGWIGVIVKSSQAARDYRSHTQELVDYMSEQNRTETLSARIMHHGSELPPADAMALAEQCEAIGGELILYPEGFVYQCEVG